MHVPRSKRANACTTSEPLEGYGHSGWHAAGDRGSIEDLREVHFLVKAAEDDSDRHGTMGSHVQASKTVFFQGVLGKIESAEIILSFLTLLLSLLSARKYSAGLRNSLPLLLSLPGLPTSHA